MAKGKFVVIVTQGGRIVKREKFANQLQAETKAFDFERRFPDADNIEIKDKSKTSNDCEPVLALSA